MSAADRPAYGEYATPEQVARARGMTLEEYESHLASLRPRADVPTPDVASAAPSVAPAPAAPATTTPVARPANRIITTALLAFGLMSVLFSVPSFLQLGAGMAAAFEMQGIGEFTSFETARVVGIVAIVVQALLWLVTLALSVATMRRGRISWWIPLVAGVLAVIVMGALMISVMTGDPAFVQYVEGFSGVSQPQR